MARAVAWALTQFANAHPTHPTTGFLADRAARLLASACSGSGGGSAAAAKPISMDAAAISKGRMVQTSQWMYRDDGLQRRQYQSRSRHPAEQLPDAASLSACAGDACPGHVGAGVLEAHAGEREYA